MSCCGQKRAQIKRTRPPVGPEVPSTYGSHAFDTPEETKHVGATPRADRDVSALVDYLTRNDRLRQR